MAELKSWLLDRLACPRDGETLRLAEETLTCSHGHSYPVVDGIPVLLLGDVEPTHGYFQQTFDWIARYREHGVPPRMEVRAPDVVDPFVQSEIALTNGILYLPTSGLLHRYPIPDLRLPPGGGNTFLDVGCNWGRWSLSAARAGYSVVGIDPSIEAVRAAVRVARQLGLDACFAVADARHLPFRPDAFDVVFSYSVLQHLDKRVARVAVKEMARVARAGGSVRVQLPNVFGVRQLYQWTRQRVTRDRNPFRVRHWTPRELGRTFEALVGPSTLEVDGFFSLNAQAADIDLLPARYARVVWSSEALRRLATHLPFLRLAADSLYVNSIKQPRA